MSTLPNLSDSGPTIDALRTAMIATMRERGFLHSDPVAHAFSAVPRHVFAPEACLEDAYNALDVVRTKFDESGAAISSVSAPYIQAMMLEQAAIRPGHRVLEIGSGGYNAALLSELVGPTGSVTTVDIDPDVTDRAGRLLDTAGYSRVAVTCLDAEHGMPGHAPYDRILVTVGAWDIPPAWRDQLAADGRLVVPLRLSAGLTRSVALEHDNGHWSSVDHQLCGFVPMRGIGAHDEHPVAVHDNVRLHLDDVRPLDVDGLRNTLLQPAVQRWSGVEFINNEPFDGLHLWLATTVTRFARLTADEAAVTAGVVDRMARWNTPSLVEGASLAYLAPLRANTEGAQHEFGVRAHGPQADRLANELIEQTQTWDQQHRHHQAQIGVYPADTELPQLPRSRVITKLHSSVVLHWPDTPAA